MTGNMHGRRGENMCRYVRLVTLCLGVERVCVGVGMERLVGGPGAVEPANWPGDSWLRRRNPTQGGSQDG